MLPTTSAVAITSPSGRAADVLPPGWVMSASEALRDLHAEQLRLDRIGARILTAIGRRAEDVLAGDAALVEGVLDIGFDLDLAEADTRREIEGREGLGAADGRIVRDCEELPC